MLLMKVKKPARIVFTIHGPCTALIFYLRIPNVLYVYREFNGKLKAFTQMSVPVVVSTGVRFWMVGMLKMVGIYFLPIPSSYLSFFFCLISNSIPLCLQTAIKLPGTAAVVEIFGILLLSRNTQIDPPQTKDSAIMTRQFCFKVHGPIFQNIVFCFIWIIITPKM